MFDSLHKLCGHARIFPKIFTIPLFFVGMCAGMAVEHNSIGFLWPAIVLIPLAIFLLLLELAVYLSDRQTLGNIREVLKPIPEAPMIHVEDDLDARWS